MSATIIGIIWALVFSVLGGLVGVSLLIALSAKLPKVFDALTPHIDEEKEIAGGNRAVAEYFGRVVSASIIGASIIIAAAVLGGILTGLR
jgi:hypothetical protein